MEDIDNLGRMGVALAIGMLIGLERGWSTRDLPEGGRVAGVRTFGLVALVGAVAALLSEVLGGVVLGFGFVALVVILLSGRYLKRAKAKDIGATTIVAALLTFALGAVAMTGSLGLAASAGVLAALLLSIKAELHSAIRKIDRQELLAVLELLIMSVVLLPVLPNRGFGPWQSLNPFEIWTMVVLICSLSFVGYVGVRLLGERRGITLAALAGALVSSTAVAITLSRLPNPDRNQARLVGGAIGFLVAAASGFVDVDAATLTLARMTPSQIPVEVGVGAVLLACVTNTVFKAAIAVFNSKGALLKPIAVGIGGQLLGLVAGAALAWALLGVAG